jgi:DNA-binding transcriptional regulator YbjK
MTIRRQKRGELTRAQVLDATLRLLAREGPRGITHRAVATEAAVSVRATTYYFTSRDDLLEQALRHYAATAIARFDALAPSPEVIAAATDPIDGAAALLAHIVMSDLEDHTGLVAEYELALEVSRKPELEPVYGAWQEELEQMLRGYCAFFGSADPALDARVLLATLRGLEIDALTHPSQPRTHAELAAVFRRLLGAMLHITK